MASLARRRDGGWSFVELLAVVGVLALLLAMGFMLYRGMRLAARVSVAENNLKQVATGMELYFREYSSYPPQGSDLTAELGPFVEDPNVFHNPLMEEDNPGDTINLLYREPTLARLDSPDNYVTAMVADNGKTMVILKTGHKVVRRDDIRFDPASPRGDVIAIIDPDGSDPGGGEDPSPDPPTDEGGFEIEEGGEVTVKMCSDVSIKCVGSQFGYADGTLVDIVVGAQLGEGWMSLYGGQPVSGGEAHNQSNVPGGTRVIVKGEIAGPYERWLWSYYGYPLSYTSTGGTGQVLTLKNGDTPVCFEPGFPCQASVGELLEPHVDPQTHVVVTGENEVLYLWDFNPLHTEYGIDYQDLIILATAVATDEAECEDQPEAEPESEPEPEPEPAGSLIAGKININPGNNEDFEFTLTKPDGSTITRDDMHASRNRLEYTGPATQVVVRPKGNGNQNRLTVDGEDYPVRNGTVYTITAAQMSVHLYNSKPGKTGRKMGKWWIEIDATGATITP